MVILGLQWKKSFMQITVDFGEEKVLWSYEKAGIEMQTNWLEPDASNTKMCVWSLYGPLI